MNMATKWKRQLLVADCGKILSGDRISLPGTVLQELEHLIVEGQSLFLKISASQAKGARSLVASVGDFNADANMVTLPVWMQQHLGVSVNGQVLISVVDEPEKAESCALQPLDARFLKIENHKAALESALSSQFNTLNEGTTIAIKHQNQLYAMHVSQLQPESCCSIMNTELIVDLIPPLGPDGKPIFIPKGSNAHKSIKKQETIEIPFGEAEGIVCKLRNSGYTIFKTMVPNITSFKVHMKTTEKSPVGADFEAYAADDSIETPEREKHQFSSTGENIESSEITITTQKNCSGRFFYVGARAYECETCEVKVAIMPEQTTSSSTDQSTQQNMIACQNCKELIPQVCTSLLSLCNDCPYLPRNRGGFNCMQLIVNDIMYFAVFAKRLFGKSIGRIIGTAPIVPINPTHAPPNGHVKNTTIYITHQYPVTVEHNSN
eukprot:m.91290 g.91290  ORF g.91290 m.91290 type:complete len:435 (-) comp13300_c0_seq1:1085-2389(-)